MTPDLMAPAEHEPENWISKVWLWVSRETNNQQEAADRIGNHKEDQGWTGATGSSTTGRVTIKESGSWARTIR